MIVAWNRDRLTHYNLLLLIMLRSVRKSLFKDEPGTERRIMESAPGAATCTTRLDWQVPPYFCIRIDRSIKASGARSRLPKFTLTQVRYTPGFAQRVRRIKSALIGKPLWTSPNSSACSQLVFEHCAFQINSSLRVNHSWLRWESPSLFHVACGSGSEELMTL